MTDVSKPMQAPPDDPAEQMAAMQRIGEKSQRVVELWLGKGGAGTLPVSADLAGDFMRMTQHVLANPLALVETQTEFWQDYLTLWQRTAQRMLGLEAEPVIAPGKDDRRFKHEQWSENAAFDFIKQSYLLSARCLHNTVRGADGLDDQTRRKVEFYTRQVVDALAPSNFAHTNPEVVAATLESGGGNLVKGLENLLDDLERGEGELKVSMTDRKAFELGRNIATSPGQVVFQNELMQLIQYAPSTKRVKRRPLLIIPPWINKFYILDLQPKSSLVRWLVDQGYAVYIVSWKNPREELREYGMDSYVEQGVLPAMRKVDELHGNDGVNVVGYCIGGTTLALTLALLGKTKAESPARSATFFTALTDFEDPGPLKSFIDEGFIAGIMVEAHRKGYLDQRIMARTFSFLRPNDLVYGPAVKAYLLGEARPKFDLLFWNEDSTRLPERMAREYLTHLYRDNQFSKGEFELEGKKVSIDDIKIPHYVVACEKDHIAPWDASFKGLTRAKGGGRFVLAQSGHIAGIVNHPDKKKYGYWVSDADPGTDLEAWRVGTEAHEGSWWPDWSAWLSKRSGKKIDAADSFPKSTPRLEPAPGRYVRE